MEPLGGPLGFHFLLPHMEEEKLEPLPQDLEYEDEEAREAEANEVTCWLQHLGLSEHCYAFQVHEIDFDVLLQLQV